MAQERELLTSDIDDCLTAIKTPGFLLFGRKKAGLARLCGAAERGERDPALALGELLMSGTDPDVAAAVTKLRHPEAVDAICWLWLANQYHPALGEVVEKAGWLASADQSLELQVFTRLCSGRLTGLESLGPEILPLVLEASDHRDARIWRRALEWLSHGLPLTWGREVCQSLLSGSCPPRARSALRQFRPQSSLYGAWLAWLVGDVNRCIDLDPAGELLSRLASLAPPGMRRPILEHLLDKGLVGQACQATRTCIGLAQADWEADLEALAGRGHVEERIRLSQDCNSAGAELKPLGLKGSEARFLGDGRVVCRVEDSLVVMDFQGKERCRIHHPEVYEDSNDHMYSWTETPPWLCSPRGDSLVTTVSHYRADNVKDRLRLWEIPTGRRVADVETGLTTAMAFSADGALLATGHYRGERHQGLQVRLRLWSLPELKPVGELDYPPTSAIHGLAFARDGRTLVVCGQQGLDRVQLTGMRSTFRVNPPDRWGRPLSLRHPPLLSPSGDRLIVGDEHSQWLQRSPEAPLEPVPWPGQPPVAWVDDDRLCCGSDNLVTLWGLTDGRLEWLHQSRPLGPILGFSAEGRHFAARPRPDRAEPELSIWDVAGGPPRATSQMDEAAPPGWGGFSPTGKAALLRDSLWSVLHLSQSRGR